MDTPAHGDDRQYWSRHFGMGIAMSILAAMVVLIRTAFRDDLPGRGFCVALGLVFLASAPPLLLLRRRILASEHLRGFFYVWDAFGVAGVTWCVALDGGGSSLYSAFYYLLVSHAALAFPPRATVISGVSVVLARLFLGLYDVRESVLDTVLQVLVLALAAMVSFFMSRGQSALVSRARSLTEQAVRLADVDGLTGCLNHRAFHARLVAESAKVTNAHPLSVLVLDVDHFKEINDGLGHLAGDEVLARLGALLRGSVRTHDVVGRIGGDEFAVLLPDADPETFEALRRRLLGELSGDALPHGGRVTIGAASTAVATDARRLLGAADAQLYATRRRERNPERAVGAR